MKKLRLLVLLVLYATCNVAWATSWNFDFQLSDARTKQPLSGVEVTVDVNDIAAGNKVTTITCSTNADGNCRANMETSGGWFSSAEINWKLKVKKDGYNSNFTGTKSIKDQTNVIYKLFLNPLVESVASKRWGLGEGPDLNVYTSLPSVSVKELEHGTSRSTGRGKFESEEDWNKRKDSVGRTLIIVPLSTRLNEPDHCSSKYDHLTGEYVVKECKIFSPYWIVLKGSELGTPIVLANAFDKREVKRSVTYSYNLTGDPGILWSASFRVNPKVAEELEGELFAAVEVPSFTVQKTCEECDARAKNNAVKGLMDSLTALQNRPRSDYPSWMDDAFKSGAVYENWNYLVTIPTPIRYFVFRKSDNKLLFEQAN